jgi:hypothetical protein
MTTHSQVSALKGNEQASPRTTSMPFALALAQLLADKSTPTSTPSAFVTDPSPQPTSMLNPSGLFCSNHLSLELPSIICC